jgi:hypothetical protein
LIIALNFLNDDETEEHFLLLLVRGTRDGWSAIFVSLKSEVARGCRAWTESGSFGVLFVAKPPQAMHLWRNML